MTDEKVQKLLCAMSLEEKIGQLVQFGKLEQRETELIKTGKVGSLLNVYGAERVNNIQKIAMEGGASIPLLIGDDVIHGYKTIFPIPLAESCSWDLQLIEDTSAIAAREASTEGINVIFAPMVDIARDPRWGRVAEGAGEDVYLGSIIAAARVRGTQRNDWNDRPGVTACPKHFIGYSAAEGGRDYNSVDISERSLRETYLPPFKAAIEAGAGTIMCSFNDLNGIPASANRFLLTDILRGELKFKGVVISDWESIEELIYHGLCIDKKEAAIKAMNAGVDIDMNSSCYEGFLLELVKAGNFSVELIDEVVARILKLKINLGLFQNAFTDVELNNKIIRDENHVEKAREAARKSIVLLKNHGNVLPLSKEIKSIAVIGPLSDDSSNPLGCWSFKGDPLNVVTVLQGIKSKVSSLTEIYYTTGSGILEVTESGIQNAVEMSKKVEVVVMVVGESKDMSGENHNRSYIGIPKCQRRLIEEVLKTGVPLVLVLMNGRPITLTWENENIPVILETWYLGDESGNAISDVLFGDYNPSGKLVMSFPRNVGQVPIYYNYKSTGRPNFKKYIDVDESPLYPFGYGLSYTKFSYNNMLLEKSKIKLGQPLRVTIEVENSGGVEGEEIVQLYIRDLVASITRPVKELKGFKKILLKPYECRTVEFILKEEELGFYDDKFNFVVETGEFHIWIGTNSIEGLKASFEVIE
jgi:beta-glucosidase